MAIEVDLDSSLRGLWVGAGPGAYLTRFFPRLDIGRHQFIPIRKGMNVLYGRNGAGKTQTLNALAAAAQWQMGPMEGLVLENPTWTVKKEGEAQPRSLSSIAADEIFRYISDQQSLATDLHQIWGYHESFVTVEKLAEALAIVREFQQAGTLLLTRGLRSQALAPDDLRFNAPSRETLLPPRSTELVPIICPDNEAPTTRAHLAQLRESLLNLLREVVEPFGYGRVSEEPDDWGFVDSDRCGWREKRDTSDQRLIEDGLITALEKWRESWAWSPILNARNLGRLNSNLDLHTDLEEAGLLAIHNRDALLFLPPIHTHIDDPFEDFAKTQVPPIFQPYQEASVGLAQGSTSKLHLGSRFSTSTPRETIRATAAKHFDEEVRNLKARLAFLPDFAGSLTWLQREGEDLDDEATLWIRRGNRGQSGGANFPATGGSRAEVRWLAFARQARGQWLFLDEPEAGLHRTGEADLAATLLSPTWAVLEENDSEHGQVRDRTIVVATHSPEFLALADANIVHIDEGRARPLTSIDRENLAVLGLRPADLLSRVRTFLLVEGEHERIVFETLFRDELHRLRVSIVVARGGKNMKDVFDSQVLFDFSDAHVVALLDNMDADHVDDLWSRARNLSAVGQVDEAGVLVREQLPRKGSGENRFLAQFLTRALEEGEHERVGAWGLAKEDIILYLPPTPFGIKRTWDEALKDYDSDVHGSLKPWLTKKFGADFNLDNIRVAAESIDEIPGEFTALLSFLGGGVSNPSSISEV